MTFKPVQYVFLEFTLYKSNFIAWLRSYGESWHMPQHAQDDVLNGSLAFLFPLLPLVAQ